LSASPHEEAPEQFSAAERQQPASVRLFMSMEAAEKNAAGTMTGEEAAAKCATPLDASTGQQSAFADAMTVVASPQEALSEQEEEHAEAQEAFSALKDARIAVMRVL